MDSRLTNLAHVDGGSFKIKQGVTRFTCYEDISSILSDSCSLHCNRATRKTIEESGSERVDDVPISKSILSPCFIF
jgi:hypothetical protein